MFLYGLAQSVSCECFEYFFTPPLVVCGVESINLYILLAQTRMWLLWRLITIITHYGHVITLKTSHWRICQTHHNLRRSRRKQRRSLYRAIFMVKTNFVLLNFRTFTIKSGSRKVLYWPLLLIKLSEKEEVRHWREERVGTSLCRLKAQADLEIYFPLNVETL